MKKKKSTDQKNWIWLISVFLLSIVGAISFIKSPYFDLVQVNGLAPAFHFNLITQSSIFGGCLFAGLGILISVIEIDRIKRLWDNHYLDNLYRSAVIGMTANLITVVAAESLVFLKFSEQVSRFLVNIEVVSSFIGIVFFAWSVKYLFYIVLRTKK